MDWSKVGAQLFRIRLESQVARRYSQWPFPLFAIVRSFRARQGRWRHDIWFSVDDGHLQVL